MTSSSLVNIDLEGETHSALVREKQRNFITGVLLHVDFQAVSLTENCARRFRSRLPAWLRRSRTSTAWS